MRVLYLGLGDTVHDRRFLSKLAGAGIDVHWLRERDAASHDPAPPGVTDHGTGGAHELAALLARLRPDVLHAGPVHGAGSLAAATGFRPLVVTSWGYDLLHDAGATSGAHDEARRVLERADLLMCDSDAVREAARRIAGRADLPVVQFPWGTNLVRFAPGPDRSEVRRRAGWLGAFVVVSLRAHEPLRGVDVALEAFRLAHEEVPQLRLVLAGDGTLRTGIERGIAEARLEDAVWLPGELREPAVAELLRAADLYLSCALTDGTSVSLLEAMASALPVVVSDVPGNREWVVAGANGWLADPRDPAAFAARILAAARSTPAELAAIGDRNRRVAEERADWDRNFARLVEAYGRLAPVAGAER